MHRCSIPHAVPLRPAARPQSRRWLHRTACSAPPAAPWWTRHSEVFTDVRDASSLETLLTARKDRLVVLEWLSPTCKHCEAAQEMMATVARALTETGESVTFGRVACDSPQTRALSKAAHVAAFPLVTLHRGGTKLLELTPSMRGGDEAAARRLQEVVASVAAETRSPRDVHFRMLAGAVQVVDGPAPEEPPRFDYAAMRAAAQAQLAQSKEGSDGDDECDSPEDAEECGVKW